MSTTLTRTAADTTVPVAGTYEVDPSHSSADFSVRHLGLSKVRGGFAIVSGIQAIGPLLNALSRLRDQEVSPTICAIATWLATMARLA